MSKAVLDASALLALLNEEKGSQTVADALADGAAISAVNLSEVVAKLNQAGMPEEAIHDALDPLGLEVVAFDQEAAYAAAILQGATRRIGLSMGDRACLALAQQAGLPAITADRAWEQVELGLEIRVIR